MLRDFDISRVEALDVREHTIPVCNVKLGSIKANTPSRLHLRTTNSENSKITLTESTIDLAHDIRTDLRLSNTHNILHFITIESLKQPKIERCIHRKTSQ